MNFSRGMHTFQGTSHTLLYLICLLLLAVASLLTDALEAAAAEVESDGAGAPRELRDLIKPKPDGVTIFVAKHVVTMSEVRQRASAVAVRNGIIIDIGQTRDLVAKFKGSEDLRIDKTFAAKVITPGLIDPHLHLWLFALVSNAQFITPADWQLPWGDVKGVVGQKAYRQTLRQLSDGMKDPDELLFSWGYHQAFHGKLNRTVLDKISSTRPIIIWQRSVHEFYFNTRALQMLGIKESDWQNKGEASAMTNWAEGHVWEKGAFLALGKLFPLIASPEKFKLGLERAKAYVHAGGITTASDPGVQLPNKMIRQMIDILEADVIPFDYYLVPAGNVLYDHYGKDADKAIAAAKQQVKALNGEHIHWAPNQIKLFTDGAVFSQLMQMKQGYLDGHQGEWIQTPKDFAGSAEAFWKAGYQITVHQNGDMGLELALDTLDSLEQRYPRFDHRFGIHHFAFSEPKQVKRAAVLGAEISSNPFYVHMLGERYSQVGVGPERAEVMARGRSVLDAGARLSFHSDSPMAPARPMLLAWSAATRLGLSGEKVVGGQERVSVEEAFRAITINAAHAIRRENEVGSIDIGKKANFTVFDENPLQAKPDRLNKLAIWGTVYEGKKYPAGSHAQGPSVATTAALPMAEYGGDEVFGSSAHHGDACAANRMFQAYAALQVEELARAE